MIPLERIRSGLEPRNNPYDLRTPEGLYSLRAVQGVGARSVLKLAERYATWGEIARSSRQELKQLVRSDEVVARLLGDEPPEVPLPMSEGVRCITYFDESYPDSLRDLADPPVLLWVRGQLPSRSTVAIVGTRRPTQWGRTVTQRIAEQAVGEGWEVISGLALGIDSEAHASTLQADGITHAVLGCGVDRPTPTENEALARSIVGAGGGLISEYPPGESARQHHFVQRNRIQAALAKAVIITECDRKSGSLYAAREALLLGRLLASPRPSTGLSKGTQSLLDSPPDTSVLPGKLTKSERSLLETRERLADVELNADLPLSPQLRVRSVAGGS
jgi:DNA processing protein